VTLLNQTLDEEKATDKKLTQSPKPKSIAERLSGRPAKA
jgi:ferritin-like metal-binding protein YciE